MTRKATPADQATATPASPEALEARILAAIAKASSRQPANADDALAQVGGDAAAYWQALERMKRDCRINVAIIRRAADPKEWMAIWPTNLPVQHRSWKDLNAVGAFGTHPAGTIHQHMPCRRDPERDPRPDLRQVTAKAAGKQTQIHGPERRDRIATLAAGRTLEHGITFHEVAADLGISVEGVRYLVKRMADGSRVAVGKRPNEHAHRLYDPTAQAGADVSLTNEGDMPAQAADEAPDPLPHQVVEPADEATADPAACAAEPCGDRPACASIAADLAAIADAIGDMEPDDEPAFCPELPRPAVRINFALWDDGGLSIYDGDDLLQLPPADTARLARLLGVPGNPLPAQEART